MGNRQLAQTNEEQSKTYQRLSSGQRINQAADDASGLAVSEMLRSNIRSMGQAQRNANDAISFGQVAEGGLTEISNIAIRLRELAVQGSSESIDDGARAIMQKEVLGLVNEINRIADVTSYNGTSLLNGSVGKPELQFQVGIRNNASDLLGFDISQLDTRSDTLGISGIAVDTAESARGSLDNIDAALTKILSNRATIGAVQNSLESRVRSLTLGRDNLVEARSRVIDADMAQDTSALIRGNILQSAGVAVLSQANSAPNQALKLLV
jgi:flagellin